MTRKEKVLTVLKKLCENITLTKIKENFWGFDAATIGEKSGISRNNASKELNLLVLEKKVIKILGRPVYFLDRGKIEKILNITLNDNQMELKSLSSIINFKKKQQRKELIKKNVFDKLIGSEGSLKNPIEQAKSALLYPPMGLNILLVGPTGVGKTTFAETMYNYGIETGRFNPNAKFNIFNCAEYANNPQLLLSQLFGYAKGAFTGAEKDKPGIIEKSNGGVLLLDEIHRLPPEGQEMLFLLMDKNIYRRLGETENVRKAKVLFIGATTNDIKSTFLKTFIRRMPIVIRLPLLSAKPISERFQLIKQFFKDEAKRVKIPIKVYKNVMKAFLLYDCPGNIGQLKGDIQLTCARGFLDYKTSGGEIIEIDTPLIPEHVYNGLFNSSKKRDEAVNIFNLVKNKYFKFSQLNNEEEFITIDEYNISEDLYKEIDDKYTIYLRGGYSYKQINEMVNSRIKKYLKKLLGKRNDKKEFSANKELFKVVSPRVYYAVGMALKAVEQKLNKKFTEKVYIALTLHISALMERIAKNKAISNFEINEIALNNTNEFHAAKLVREILEEELEINIPKQEISFIAMFLDAVNLNDPQKNNKIGVIVLAHGRYTASSIANVVNSILVTNHCRAINMPLNEKVEDTLERTIKLVKEINQGKGVLLLVDMGSLVTFAEIITKKTNIKTMSVETVSTPIVIEAVRKSLFTEMTLETLTEDLQKVNPYTGRLVINNIKNKAFAIKPRTIIITCLTGEGSAVRLGEILKSTLPVIDEYNIKLKSINKVKFRKMDKNENEELIAVVGTVNLNIPDVPYISIDEVIIGDGLKRIEKIIIDVGNNYTSMDTGTSNFIVKKTLKEYLMFLDPNKTYETVNRTFNKINELIEIKDYKREKIKYILHGCCMIERILMKEPMPYKDVEKLIRSKIKLYKTIKDSTVLIEETFNIKIPDTEIGYIIEIFDTQ